MLKAREIFLGKMQKLHGNGNQVDGKNRRGILFPGRGYPQTLRQHQTAAEQNDRRPDPVSMRRRLCGHARICPSVDLASPPKYHATSRRQNPTA
jgi:hypothetical protein